MGFTPYLVEMLKAMIAIGENHFASYGAMIFYVFYHFTDFLEYLVLDQNMYKMTDARM